MRFKNKDLFWKFFITIRLWFEKNELSYHDYLLRQIFQLSLSSLDGKIWLILSYFPQLF